MMTKARAYGFVYGNVIPAIRPVGPAVRFYRACTCHLVYWHYQDIMWHPESNTYSCPITDGVSL